MATTLLVVLGVVLFLIVYIVMVYNRLVKLKNRFKNAFSQIDVQLKRRYDLIPNLVETAKAYLKHEHETLQEVIEARNSALAAIKGAERHPGNPAAMKSLIGAEAALGGAMLNLNAVMENYPDLKADQTMAQLSEELTSTENKVSFARQSYNDEVMAYNTQRETFPDVMLAPMFGFMEAALWRIESQEEKQAPKVSF
ncbi:LemA protein [Mariprofundus aestuarium]|uniref:LemA protein n=1 Tax=Mariprofundus aestuarium TaxID=1921086 RepID=A0A2K8KZ20_MARES|nr:LemA family protein [Mariprofundus aestuarium]ATX80032.1 LemA protein [Mariprofundus aestuarium]